MSVVEYKWGFGAVDRDRSQRRQDRLEPVDIVGPIVDGSPDRASGPTDESSASCPARFMTLR